MTQPTEPQPARDDLYDALDQSWYRWDPQSMAKGTGIIRLIDAHAAEVRAATLREAADAIDAETAALKADGVLEPDKHRPCRDASAQLRRLAAGEAR